MSAERKHKRLTQQALQRIFGQGAALVTVLITGFLVITYWDSLTKPVVSQAGLLAIIGVRPVASALRIGVLFFVVYAICASLAGLLSGRLIKRLSRHGVEFDEPSDEALATKSLHKRVTELEETQKKTLEAHKKEAEDDEE